MSKISPHISLEILQQWCSQNNFDAYHDQGLRPGYFEFGVRGIQAVPQTPYDNSNLRTILPSTNPNPQQTHPDNILSDSHLIPFINSIHSTRNNIQFTHEKCDNQNDGDCNDCDQKIITSINPTLQSLGTYPYRIQFSSDHPVNIDEHNGNNCESIETISTSTKYHKEQQPEDEDLSTLETKRPIIQIPYHLLLSPSRFLFSNPFLLNLVASINLLQLHQSFNRFIEATTPTNDNTVFDTIFDLCLFNTQHPSISPSSNLTRTIKSQSSQFYSTISSLFLSTISLTASTTTPIPSVISDLDVFILSLIEYCRSLHSLSNPVPSTTSTFTQHSIPNIASTIINNSRINIYPYIIALPEEYDHSLHWTHDQLELITFSSLTSKPNTTTHSPLKLPKHVVGIYEDIVLRFGEWLKLNIVLIAMWCAPSPQNFSFTNLFLFKNINTSDNSQVNAFPNKPIISFQEYLFAYSTVATRSVFTPPPPLPSSMTSPHPITTLHFPNKKQHKEAICWFNSTDSAVATLTTNEESKGKNNNNNNIHSSLPTTTFTSNNIAPETYRSIISLYSLAWNKTISPSNQFKDALLTAFLYLLDPKYNLTSKQSQLDYSTSFSPLNYLYQVYSHSDNFDMTVAPGVDVVDKRYNEFCIDLHKLTINSLVSIDTTSHSIHRNVLYQKHNYDTYKTIGDTIIDTVFMMRMRSDKTIFGVDGVEKIHTPSIQDVIPKIISSSMALPSSTSVGSIDNSLVPSTSIGSATNSEFLIPFSDQALIPFFDLLNHSDQIAVDVSWEHIPTQPNIDVLIPPTQDQSIPDCPSQTSKKFDKEGSSKKDKGSSKINKSFSTSPNDDKWTNNSQVYYSIMREPATSHVSSIPWYSRFTKDHDKEINPIQSPPTSEVFISYGALSNLDLFTRYGFVLPQNKQDVLPIPKSFIDSIITSPQIIKIVSSNNSAASPSSAQSIARPVTARPPVTRPAMGRPPAQKPGQPIKTASTDPSHTTNKSTETILQELFSHPLQTGIINRLLLHSLLPSASPNSTQANDQVRYTKAEHSFKFHPLGLPFDLLVYLFLLTLPSSLNDNNIKTLQKSNHPSQPRPSNTQQLQQPNPTQLLAQITQYSDVISDEMIISSSQLEKIFEILKIIIISFIKSTYIAYFSSLLIEVNDALLGKTIELLNKQLVHLSQVSLSNEKISPKTTLIPITHQLTALIGDQVQSLATNPFELNMYWSFIAVTMVTNHIQLLMNSLIYCGSLQLQSEPE